MESGAFYSVRGLLLKSLPVRAEVQAGSACRATGALESGFSGPARFYAPPYGGGGFYGKSVRPIMSGGFYGKRYALFGL